MVETSSIIYLLIHFTKNMFLLLSDFIFGLCILLLSGFPIQKVIFLMTGSVFSLLHFSMRLAQIGPL